MALRVGARLGAYEVVGGIGAGGMGEVYRARDTRLGRDVALKVLPENVARDQERLARFGREAQLLASLNHPNVGAIYGLEDSAGAPALVLELVEGPTLADRIVAGPMGAAEALPIARQVAEALEYAHEHGVVHRDLKPANVKLDAEGRAKVLDFGLAKAIAGDATAIRSDPSFSPTITSLGTMAGVMIGTAAYMAPEQARGAAVDRRADIWAFGALLYEMLTARRAFEGETVSDTLAAVLRAPVEWGLLPAATPRSVVHLLERCLERDPKRRLRDIGEARILLESWEHDPEAAEPAGTAAASAAVPASRRLASGLLPWTLCAAALVALVWVLVSTRRTEPPAPAVRFEVPAVAKLRRMVWPRISPDGQTLAFQGFDAAGKSSVWVRPLGVFEPYLLSGSEGAERPFWSPDSRYIAFFKKGQLLKVPVAGGPSQLLCESATGSDGSWGSTGVILFDGRADDPLRRCSAAGGVVADQSAPNKEADEAQHSWPAFLPDGRHYLFVVTTPGKSTIHVAALDEPGSKPLVATDSRIDYGSGHILHVLQGTLVAQRFDDERLETIGDPVPLASGLGADARPGFSASTNGVLAYLAAGASSGSRLVWVDRSGQDIETVGDVADYRDLALSPDGTLLAYGEGSQNEDVWVRDLKRGVTTRLTSDSKFDGWPVWSPDGTRVLFTADRSGNLQMMTRSAAATGAEEPFYSVPAKNFGSSDWSRDGRFATSTLVAGAPPDAYVLSIGAETTAAPFAAELTFAESGARFSPDGKWIAYTSNETGRAEVYIQPYPPTGAKWTISSGGGRVAQWRGDGKELFFESLEETIFAVPVTLGTTLEAGIPTPLFTRKLERSGRTRNRWVVSADGERFLLNVAPEGRVATPFSVVLHWPETLRTE